MHDCQTYDEGCPVCNPGGRTSRTRPAPTPAIHPTREDLEAVLMRLGRKAADARGVRFNGILLGSDGVESDLEECIAAKVRERRAGRET